MPARLRLVRLPVAAITITPQGSLRVLSCRSLKMSGESCAVASCLSGTTHSFVVSKKGVFTSFDPPGAVSSAASTVNPSGAVVGFFTDSGGVGHGYLRYHGTFTTIDFPGATFTFAGAINPKGDIVGEYNDTAGVGHAFLLSNGVFTSFDFPGAIFTDASGINPGGIIVGVYVDSANAEHGFIRTP
jgi:probable HAF family extracellular repeat protein